MSSRSFRYVLKRKLAHPIERAPGPIARPRDAATLILVRRNADAVEVLMGRRSRKASFIPDAFVFPGGRVDPIDAAVAPATRLDEALIPHMAVGGSEARARMFAMTAVRETFEETGLLLVRPGDVGEPGEGRGSDTWLELRNRKLAPDLRPLDYVGRAITSPNSKIRFHARFFMADAKHCQGTLGGSGELSDLAWIPLDDAAKLPIVDVTEFMLGEIARLTAAPEDRARARPLFSYRNQVTYVRYG